MTSFDLNNKVIMITGGTGGLGSATARALLAKGARVAILDLDPKTADFASSLSPDRAIGLTVDVCDRNGLDLAVTEVTERLGRLDVAIANAGILGLPRTVRATPPAIAEKVLQVNISGVLNTVAASIEEVIANQGQVVVISSVFAFMNGMGAAPYAMSKAAVEQLGRALRVELAQHGASVLTAYFALIQTEMIRQGVDADPHVAELVAATPKPLQKRLEAREAAQAIVRGIERRDARLIKPRRWAALSATRGFLGPALDGRFVRDAATQAVMKKLDRA